MFSAICKFLEFITIPCFLAKFKKFDLIGIPYQIILGSKSTNDKFEFKEINGKAETLSLDEIKKKLLNKRNLN